MSECFQKLYARCPNPKISLIISTRNRGKSLSRCLSAIAKLRANMEWELIVVDNGSSDNTASVIEEFANLSKLPLTYVFQPKKGLSNARNAGCLVARGEILAFTDDDCYIDEGYLDALTDVFKQRDIGYATGRIMLFDPFDYPVTINESTKRKCFPPGHYIPPGDIKGANMAFRKVVLEQISGFDPLFGSGSFFPSEDCDAAARASLTGWKGIYEPDICVYHHHGRKAGDVVGLFKDYDVGRGAYHAKLLIHGRKLKLFLRGLKGLPRRFLERPSSLYWEVGGMMGYFLRYCIAGATSAKGLRP